MSEAPDISEDDMTTMFATNVTGLINMTQAIMPIFLKRPEGGRGDIINIGSGAGREAYAGGGVYCATKAAVRSFSDSLRKELIATRIRVIEIDPGQVETVRKALFTRRSTMLTHARNFLLFVIMETKERPMLYTRESHCLNRSCLQLLTDI